MSGSSSEGGSPRGFVGLGLMDQVAGALVDGRIGKVQGTLVIGVDGGVTGYDDPGEISNRHCVAGSTVERQVDPAEQPVGRFSAVVGELLGDRRQSSTGTSQSALTSP